jgi:hypothetical protein
LYRLPFCDFQSLGFGGVFCILFAAAGKKYAAEGITADLTAN